MKNILNIEFNVIISFYLQVSEVYETNYSDK